MVILSILWLVTLASSQTDTTGVYPSEDELLEALRLGEIDYDRYRLLLELLTHGIDSSNAYLLDEIPNLGSVLGESRGGTRDGVAVEPASVRTPRPHDWLLRFEHRYYAQMNPDHTNRYHSTLTVRPLPKLSALVRLDRTYSGRERIIARAVRYKSSHGTVREVVVGNFSQRLGLGTVIGYRGRLLDSRDCLDGEALAFPDYGGGNGGYLRLAHGRRAAETVVSLKRDAAWRLATAGLRLSGAVGRNSVAVTFGFSRLTARATDATVTDVKVAAYARHRYAQGRIDLELTGQSGERKGFGALIVDGNHNSRTVDLRYAGWIYGDRFFDLAAGSRTGPLSRRDSVGEVSFSFLTRRTGARGGTVTAAVPLSSMFIAETTLRGGGFNLDTLRVEALTGFTASLTDATMLRIDFLVRRTHRETVVGCEDADEQRARVEVRVGRPRLAVRTYLAHTARDGDPDYVSLFCRLRCDSDRLGRFELWSNLARLTVTPTRNNYWYVYGRLRQTLAKDLCWAVKLSHRYSRSVTNSHLTTIALEVETEL